MGTVYAAQHQVMGRKAAIKVMHPLYAADPTLVARFQNEARAAHAIRHPNIIDVLDVGVLAETGLPYLVMEQLEGESLGARLGREGALPLRDALAIAEATADALQAAHVKRIVHRDLKPDNLFLVSDPATPLGFRVKVLDFGIAKLRDQSQAGPHTRPGLLLGTPRYMSPEQCRGLPAEIDHRTDVYALGIILYEMLCGAPPFDSEADGDLLMMHVVKPPKPPRALDPRIPVPVESAILRALSKRKEDRFASMAELQAALAAAAAVPTPPDEPARRGRRIGIVVAIAALTAGAGAIALRAARAPSRPPHEIAPLPPAGPAALDVVPPLGPRAPEARGPARGPASGSAPLPAAEITELPAAGSAERPAASVERAPAAPIRRPRPRPARKAGAPPLQAEASGAPAARRDAARGGEAETPIVPKKTGAKKW